MTWNEAEYRANVALIRSRMNPISQFFTGCGGQKYQAEMVRDLAGGKELFTIRFFFNVWWVYPKYWTLEQAKKFIILSHQLKQNWTREKYDELEAFKQELTINSDKQIQGVKEKK